MSMKTIKWRLDIVGAENDPLAVAKDAARYMQAEALSQLYEVTDAEGNRFHVDLESETVTEIESTPELRFTSRTKPRSRFWSPTQTFTSATR